MASPNDPDDDIFENLKRSQTPEFEQKRQAEVNERLRAQEEAERRRLAALADENATLPVTINSVRILGANHTRRNFLARIFDPLLSANKDRPFTFQEALAELSAGANKLQKFDIFQHPISLYIDQPDKTDPNTTPGDIDVFISVKERSRLMLKTGTDLGNTEGSAYGNLLWRNVFGGAESLNVNASIGTRTRSSYSVGFETPILSNPDLRWEIGGLASSTQKAWSSHEEVLKGGETKLKWTSGSSLHELGYSGVWRQVTSLAEKASPTVREDAGDSMKSSITHTWVKDGRDHQQLPTKGSFMKTISEIAGWGPLKGDVAWWKSEIDTQGAVPVPGIKGASLTAGLRAGLLCPLLLNGKEQVSRINDRFQLGGPTDVRGFRLSGLGPHDGSDAVGGDVYAAGSANLLLPLPRVGADKPLRFQTFLTGGRLLAMKKDGVQSTIAELGNGLPSMSAGVGLVYAHPVARFELNFSLPLVLRKGEEGRKGLSFGVGINFL